MLAGSRRVLSQAAGHVAAASRGLASLSAPEFETLRITQAAPHVAEIALNRPTKNNAMNKVFWTEIAEAFDWASDTPELRAILLTGGDARHYTSGIDLEDHVDLLAPPAEGAGEDTARRAFELRRVVKRYQDGFTAIERCPKPVIAAIHGACIGGGVDMICAADVRLASSDAYFCVKEVAIGIAADVGTLQRLPRVVGNDSWIREACFTARNIPAHEAAAQGLLSRVYTDKKAMLAGALATAEAIAAHSPVAVQGTKINLNFSRGRTVSDGLEFQSAWNAAMLQTQDLGESMTATMTGKPARFSKL